MRPWGRKGPWEGVPGACPITALTPRHPGNFEVSGGLGGSERWQRCDTRCGLWAQSGKTRICSFVLPVHVYQTPARCQPLSQVLDYNSEDKCGPQCCDPFQGKGTQTGTRRLQMVVSAMRKTDGKGEGVRPSGGASARRQHWSRAESESGGIRRD